MPRGTSLPDEDWAKRHRVINTIAVLHVPVVFVYALLVGFDVAHALLEITPIAVCALLGQRKASTRLAPEVFTTLSLVISCAVLVHLSGGYIELHFHFFVIVGLVTLYHQWRPFLLAIIFVCVHHGVAASIDPQAVYNHPAAIAHPWTWAAVHAFFVLMASLTGIANWKLNELARARAERYYRRLYEGEHAIVRRLEEADRQKNELVAAVSHEFRTPLTSIIGFSDILGRRTDLPPDRINDVASRIHRQGRRLQQLVENLLEAENPLKSGDGAGCDATTVIRATVLMALEGQPADERCPVEMDVAPGLQLPLPSQSVDLVVANLVTNAVKFATPGTPVVVRGSGSSRDGVTISVSNQGQGVAPHLRERIFEPFVQGDSSDTRTADGVGLGLHLVRRIVTANQGHVSVESRAGTTTFTVWLPAKSNDAPVGSTSPPQARSDGQPDGSSPTTPAGPVSPSAAGTVLTG